MICSHVLRKERSQASGDSRLAQLFHQDTLLEVQELWNALGELVSSYRTVLSEFGHQTEQMWQSRFLYFERDVGVIARTTGGVSNSLNPVKVLALRS